MAPQRQLAGAWWKIQFNSCNERVVELKTRQSHRVPLRHAATPMWAAGEGKRNGTSRAVDSAGTRLLLILVGVLEFVLFLSCVEYVQRRAFLFHFHRIVAGEAHFRVWRNRR